LWEEQRPWNVYHYSANNPIIAKDPQCATEQVELPNQNHVVVKSDLPFKVSLKMAQALGNQHHNKKRQEIQVMRKVRYRLQKGKEHLAAKDQPNAQQRKNLLKSKRGKRNTEKSTARKYVYDKRPQYR